MHTCQKAQQTNNLRNREKSTCLFSTHERSDIVTDSGVLKLSTQTASPPSSMRDCPGQSGIGWEVLSLSPSGSLSVMDATVVVDDNPQPCLFAIKQILSCAKNLALTIQPYAQ
jgi:hypothetical protein